MAEPEVDYAAVFQALPGAVALVTPQLVYADANAEFVRLRGLTREQLVGRFVPEDVPEKDPAEPLLLKVLASLRRVADTGESSTVELQRYDVEDPEQPGVWHERYWNLTDVPVFGPDGRLSLVLHRVEDVTELIRAREVALTLQEAMLPAPRPVGRHPAAVRYRPAAEALNVAGDWYDLIDLPGDRIAVAVGDVVGNGLPAACVMGQLRSALTAASLVAEGPAHALETVGLYARTIDGAENTTVATTFIDWDTHTITYSSAGHPHPHCYRGTGPSNSWTRPPTPHWAPALNTPPGSKPPQPSRRAPSSRSTPTA
ncbi:Phosphoserine phosphatase RsbU [Streptomyces sp. MBT84]|nr:Phosphoserine phosphatase RsbU [Streptomyces sp. MBT84]